VRAGGGGRGGFSGRLVPDPAPLHIIRHGPAKLNLTLAILGRRADGFHSLHSIMVPLALGDALTVSAAPRSHADSLRVVGVPVSTGPDNLILRAIAATRAAVIAGHAGPIDTAAALAEVPSLAVRLNKCVPVAAGLGGGSSDAAAAIDAALAAWGATLPRHVAREVAASLGSDVPFFLAGGAALVTGRGEFVEPLPDLVGEPPAVLLVTPRVAVSTAAVFGAYDRVPRGARRSTAHDVSRALAEEMRAGLTSERLLARAADLAGANDLQAASLESAPQLEEFRRALASIVGRPVCQSGSGPTVWVLYDSLVSARKAARFVRLAVGDGRLPAIGEDEPFIDATTIHGRGGATGVATTQAPAVHNAFSSDTEKPEGR
jgi:4-diphosphocytidyl-2-C-methyl-D-erythritol kinase